MREDQVTIPFAKEDERDGTVGAGRRDLCADQTG